MPDATASLYCAQAFLITSSTGVKLKPGKAVSKALFANDVWLCATFAVSFESRGLLPVKKAFAFSRRHATSLMDGLA